MGEFVGASERVGLVVVVLQKNRKSERRSTITPLYSFFFFFLIQTSKISNDRNTHSRRICWMKVN